MKGTIALATSLLSTTAFSQALLWDIEKRHANKLHRRADKTVQEDVKNEQSQGGYFATVKIGNPPQEMSLQLDTGSSDVWVPWIGAEACARRGGRRPTAGCVQGAFDPDSSKTFDNLGDGTFEINYVDKSGAKGNYFTDDFIIGGTTVKNLTMGLGIDTDIAFGLCGVGYANNEASIDTVRSIYPNLPVALQDDGIIKSVAYSLWLNDLGASKGNILFGGIDTEKYQGELTRLDIIKDEKINKFTHFQVALSGVDAVSSSGTDAMSSSAELPLTAVLDSGTTLSYLPTDMAKQIWDEVGATYDPDLEFAALPCSRANNDGYFSFVFGGSNGPRINVTMDELVLDLTGGSPPEYSTGPFRGESACAFGIQNQTISDEPYLLGDTFLRSAYVVYDLVNNKVAIAPTKFNASDSNIVAFSSHGAPIPSATPVQKNATQPEATSQSSSNSASAGFQQHKDGSSEDSAATTGARLSSVAAIGSFAALIYML